MSQKDEVIILETDDGQEETWKVINGMTNQEMIAGVAVVSIVATLIIVAKNHKKRR